MLSPVQWILLLIVILPLVGFWLWMFRDLIQNVDLPASTKESWSWAFIFLNVFTAAVYFVTVYRYRNRR